MTRRPHGKVCDRCGENAMAGRVDGKVALVTGAASGLGAESARRLAREGAKVVLTDLAEDLGEQVAGEIPGAIFMTQDVTDEARWTEVVDATLERFGKIDVLVNSAGIGEGGQSI